MQIIEQVKSALVEGTFKTLAIDDEGKFGLATPSAMRTDRGLVFVSPPASLATVVMASRAVMSGEPRAVTAPGVTQGLAIGVLAVAWKLGQVAEGLDTVIEENQRLRALCGEAAAALSDRGLKGDVFMRLSEAAKEGK